MTFGLRKTRKLIGLGDIIETTRGGVRWSLDLREGIDLAIYLGTYQTIPARVVELLRNASGSTALDIGANIGAFTLHLARSVGDGGHVIAFEATAFAFEKLTRNLALNPELRSRVTARQAVLGDGQQNDAATAIYSSWRVDGTHSESDHPLHGGRLMSTQGAVATSLDALAENDAALQANLARLKFVKLDVDGHELPILRGARRTLAASRPTLLIEIAPHVQDERDGGLPALVDELERQGYRLHDPVAGQVVSHKPADLRSMIPHGAGIDLLAVMAR